jgi:hypothetical protein
MTLPLRGWSGRRRDRDDLQGDRRRRGQAASPESQDRFGHVRRPGADHVGDRDGSDVWKRIAAPMAGGILSSFIIELVV